MEITCYVTGSRDEFDLLFQEANVRFGAFKSGKYEVILRLPECNVKQSPYRYSRCKTIKGLHRKLRNNKHLIKDYTC